MWDYPGPSVSNTLYAHIMYGKFSTPNMCERNGWLWHCNVHVDTLVVQYSHVVCLDCTGQGAGVGEQAGIHARRPERG